MLHPSAKFRQFKEQLSYFLQEGDFQSILIKISKEYSILAYENFRLFVFRTFPINFYDFTLKNNLQD